MAEIPIDYTSKDYEGFRSSLLQHASTAFPAWQSRSEGDFGVMLVELFSYMGDILSYYGDRIAQEAFLGTATQRSSVLQIADALGYVPAGVQAASGTVVFQTEAKGVPVVVPAGTRVATGTLTEIGGPLIYETYVAVTVPGSGGTVTAEVVEGQTQADQLIGVSNGTPDQQFRLPHKPVIADSVELYVEGALGRDRWTSIQHLIEADSRAKVFEVRHDDSGSAWVVLGDGISGAIPAMNMQITATYRMGGGVLGNQPAGSVRAMVTPITGVKIAVDSANVPRSSEMVGGADMETTESIRRNAPLAYRTQNRLVTLQDYIDAALSVTGVSQANAVANHFTSVTVFVRNSQGGDPSTALKDAVYDRLSAQTLAGVTVSVAAPITVTLRFTDVRLDIDARAHQKTVVAAAKKAIQSLFTPDRTSFGMRVSLGEVYSALRDTPGVRYAYVGGMKRETPNATAVTTEDIQLKYNEVPNPLPTIEMTATGGVV